MFTWLAITQRLLKIFKNKNDAFWEYTFTFLFQMGLNFHIVYFDAKLIKLGSDQKVSLNPN